MTAIMEPPAEFDSPEEFMRRPPHDKNAEQWTLGACMWTREAMSAVIDVIDPEDFYTPAHQMIFLACVTIYSQGHIPDPVLVNEELTRRAEIGRCGGAPYLHTLYSAGSSMVPASAGYHAAIIRDKASRRKVIEVATRMVQAGYAEDSDLEDVVSQAASSVSAAMMTAATARSFGSQVMTADRFMSAHSTRPPAVIPGLLDHLDRAIIVGFEGDGKSTLSYQLAVAVASGIHPFVWTEAIEPVKVLIADFENPRHIMENKLRQLADVADRWGRWMPSNVEVLGLPAGVDLTQTSDRFRMTELINRTEPDIIITGPIRKMLRRHRGMDMDEMHGEFTHYWDQIRERFSPALWIEHHAPKGPGNGNPRELTPFGSQIYMGWPEFGIGLRRQAKGTLRLDRFRGDREEGRPWPEKLERNGDPWPRFPWKPRYGDATFQPTLVEDVPA